MGLGRVAGGSLGYERPCDHQRQVPAVHVVRELGGAPVPVHRQSGGLFRCAPATYTHSANCAEDRRDPTGAILGHGGDARCCTTTGAWVTSVQKTVVVPQLQFSDNVVDIPVVAQRQIPMVQSVQKTIEILQLQYIDKVVDVPGVISVVCWGKDANQGQYWIVREMGYVRVAFGALNVESQCLWAVVQNC